MGFSKQFVEEIRKFNKGEGLLVQAMSSPMALEALLRIESRLDPTAVQARVTKLELKELVKDCERAIKAEELLHMLLVAAHEAPAALPASPSDSQVPPAPVSGQ